MLMSLIPRLRSLKVVNLGLPSVIFLQVQHIHILVLLWGHREFLPVLTVLAHDGASLEAEEPLEVHTNGLWKSDRKVLGDLIWDKTLLA